MKTKLTLLIALLFFLQLPSIAAKRGLWVWYTNLIIGSTNEVNKLINQCKTDNITDIYLYAYGFLTTEASKSQMRSFIAKAKCNNINVWAMDGSREYFSDWGGPTTFYNFITSVINYNSSSSADERFIGVHGDNEPQDGQGEPRSSFHNDITDSGLNTGGGGVWQTTQALDREYLMRDWITITQTAYNTCHANNLLFGQAMPSWMDDYYGETVQCTWGGIKKPVYQHIMQYMDDYAIMSYRTTPAQVIARVSGELAYANTLPAASRPQIFAGLETHCGVGSGISYCDTPGKNSKTALWTDIATIEATLNTYASYSGMNIHDWIDGYRDLPSVSNNTTNPSCPLPVQLISFTGESKNFINHLRWSTSIEMNNDRFDIEKSGDGISFEYMTSISGAGHSSTIQEYEITDENPFNGITYYKLTQVDLDGITSTPQTIAVRSENNSHIYTYPNPASDNIHIVANDESSSTWMIELYSAEGKVVASFTEVSGKEISLHVSQFSPGIYLLRATNTAGNIVLHDKVEIYY